MSSPINPSILLSRSLKINGVDLLRNHYPIGHWLDAIDEVVESYSDFPEDQGFGSSDFTYAVKSLLDTLIEHSKLPLKTEFTPCLSVVTK